MKKFLTYNLIFFGVIFIPISIAVAVFHKYIPGPKITTSYSYNEKMKFIVNSDIKQAEVLAVGSSVTFNNLNSEIVKNSFQTESYLNLSSWGLRMNDSYLMIKQMVPYYNPKTIIMVSSPVDFYGSTIVYNSRELQQFVSDRNLLKYHYKFFDSKYFIKRLITNKMFYDINDQYKSLNHDKYGAVMLDGENIVINQNRWNHQTGFHNLWPAQYLYLDSIAAFLSAQSINLILIQNPVRKDIFNDYYAENFNKHKKKVDEVLLRNNQIKSINCTDTIWNDNFFVDNEHLNETGAMEITSYWINKYLRKINNK